MTFVELFSRNLLIFPLALSISPKVKKMNEEEEHKT
jgi:hypothetical protein